MNNCQNCRWSFVVDEPQNGEPLMLCWPNGDISKERAADIPDNIPCPDYMEL